MPIYKSRKAFPLLASREHVGVRSNVCRVAIAKVHQRQPKQSSEEAYKVKENFREICSLYFEAGDDYQQQAAHNLNWTVPCQHCPRYEMIYVCIPNKYLNQQPTIVIIYIDHFVIPQHIVLYAEVTVQKTTNFVMAISQLFEREMRIPLFCLKNQFNTF